MPRFTFTAILRSAPGGGSLIEVPPDVVAGLGPPPRQRVRGTLDGIEYDSNIGPMGAGRTCLGIHKAVREGARAAFGDTVTIEIESNHAPRTVVIPDELEAELARDPAAREAFGRLSYTNRKEMAVSVAEAKRPETRERRLAVAMARLRSQ